MLDDIAVLTAGKAVFKDLGIQLENVEIQELGRAKKVTIDADNTTIVQGAGGSEAISGRIKQIRNEMEITTSDYDKEKATRTACKACRRRRPDIC